MTQQQKDWNLLKREAIDRLRSGGELSGSNGALQPLIKDILESALAVELEEHLSKDASNRKNGKVSKTVKSDYGAIELERSRH